MKYLFFKCIMPGLLLASNLFAQTHYQNIEIYSKVWGFIKYHHPAVAAGSINWDSVFIAHIDKVMNINNPVSFNNEITATINAAGPIKTIVPLKIPYDVFMRNHDLKWMSSPKLSLKNREKLNFIYKNHNQGPNHFVKFANYTDYSGENQYPEITWATVQYRLLFLARFWNAINYFAPYKYLIGEDWNTVLKRFVPETVSVTDTSSYYRLQSRLAKSLNDGHSSFTVNYRSDIPFAIIFGKLTAPFYCKLIDNRLLIKQLSNDSLCKTAGIMQGDEIISIEQKPVTLWLNQRRRYISASNKTGEDEALSWYALDDNAPTFNLTISRNGELFKTKVERMPASKKNWNNIIAYTGNQTGYEWVNKSTLLIYAGQITAKNIDTLRTTLFKAKAIIFDMRNYPADDAFYNIMGPLLSQSQIINYSTYFTTDNPGIFKWKPSPKIGERNPGFYKGKVIILVDEHTQSQGEYCTMVLQTIPGSIVIGSQTMGCDGVVSYIPMGGKYAISYSGYGIYYPDANRTTTQRTGVKIDITVNKTVASVITGKDLIKDAALKYLRSLGIE